MLKKFLLYSLIFLTVANINLSYSSYAEDVTTTPKRAETSTEKPTDSPIKEPDPQKEMTKEEILEYLNMMFTHRLDIREKVPGLLEVENTEDNYFEFNGLRLEKMSRDALFGLMKYVNQEVSKKNLENLQRTQRQLRQLKQIQQINRNQRMLRDLRKNRNNR